MRIVNKILLFLLVLCLILGTYGIWLGGKYVTPIMMYHSVGEGDESNVNVISPENFRKQMRYLKSNHFNVISLDEFVEGRYYYHPKKKSVVITFDDGYKDNYTHAFEILKNFDYPATIFVVTERIGTQGYMTWDQLRKMSEQGITIGSHTRHHVYLPDLNEQDQREQIFKSKQKLEAKLKKPIDFISYPFGGYNEDTVRILEETGFKAACTTNRSHDRLNRNRYALKRIRFGNQRNSSLELWAKLSGYYENFRKTKNPY